MRLPETITFILFKLFGIINCKKCGHLIVNPTDDKIMKHVEYCSERELDQDELDFGLLSSDFPPEDRGDY